MIKPAQIEAARRLLGWTLETLAGRSHQSLLDTARVEQGATFATHGIAVQQIQLALEGAGVEFLNHEQPGVRLREPKA